MHGTPTRPCCMQKMGGMGSCAQMPVLANLDCPELMPMSGPHFKYVLVGGGLASSAAAQAIRAIDTEGNLLLVGQEVNRPYHRPPLSKQYLQGKTTRRELFTLPDQWFIQHQVELRTGRRASLLDTSRRMVALDNGEEIAFDKLLIATGASPNQLRIPGSELPNIF